MTMHYSFVVTQDEAGLRLDRFIADRSEELSRSFAQKLISEGHITIHGSRMKSSHNVCAGDVVRIELPAQRPHAGPRAESIPLDVVFEDNELIVVNKPAGMVVHPAAGVDSGTLVNAILAHIPSISSQQADGLSLSSITPERPGIVHRIDKGTSGLLVVAKTVKAYYNLVDQFREHSVRRKYTASSAAIRSRIEELL